MQKITQDKAPQRAAMLAHDVAFQRYAATRSGLHGEQFSSTAATEHLRTVCQIKSAFSACTLILKSVLAASQSHAERKGNTDERPHRFQREQQNPHRNS
jgi:HD-GYP domain-containing protein (c-di-GMP phosphodiesterase class II)